MLCDTKPAAHERTAAYERTDLMKTMRKPAAVMLSAAMALSALAVTAPEASAEWVKSKSGYSYKDDGTGERLKGWQTIAGDKFYFNKDGIALTGWKKINGDTYYFNASKRGKMLTGWAKIGGKQYYFGTDGVMRTGWVTLKGSTYYFGTTGVMLSGNSYKIDGKIYTFGKDGRLVYSSAALGCNALSVTNGVTFGKTTVPELEKKLPYEDYEADETGILFMPTDTSLGCYLCSEENVIGGCMLMYTDISDIKEVRPFFTEAGWSLTDTKDIEDSLTEMYVSPDGSVFGYAIVEDDIAMIMVGSYDNVDELYYEFFEELE